MVKSKLTNLDGRFLQVLVYSGNITNQINLPDGEIADIQPGDRIEIKVTGKSIVVETGKNYVIKNGDFLSDQEDRGSERVPSVEGFPCYESVLGYSAFILCLIVIIFKFVISSTPEDDARMLAGIIDRHNGKITASEACKEAGFDADRCDKANSIVMDAMTNKVLKGLGK